MAPFRENRVGLNLSMHDHAVVDSPVACKLKGLLPMDGLRVRRLLVTFIGWVDDV